MAEKIRFFGVTLLLFFVLNMVVYGCAAIWTDSSTTYEDQKSIYENCIKGAPAETAQHWNRECFLKSAEYLPAPLLSAFFPITYSGVQTPKIEEIFTFTVETQEAQVYRRLAVVVEQTWPVGKRVTAFARLHAVELDDVCIFFDNNGKVESMAETCYVTLTQRWYPGQAGYDGRTATRIKAAGIAEEITKDLYIGSSYDYLGSLFHKPQ